MVKSVEVGEEVLVDIEELGRQRVRVTKLVPDVNAVAGPPDPRCPKVFCGPGFEARGLAGDFEGMDCVFSYNQVISKKSEYGPSRKR